jgi:hypothetical protein
MPHWWIDANPPGLRPTVIFSGSEDVCLTCLLNGTETSDWRAATERDHPDHYRPLSELQPPVKLGKGEEFVEAELQYKRPLTTLALRSRTGHTYTGLVQTWNRYKPPGDLTIFTVNADPNDLTAPWHLNWEISS